MHVILVAKAEGMRSLGRPIKNISSSSSRIVVAAVAVEALVVR
jgi:hypothetical protein